ncbi:DUF6907 domain-containing protein [Streptomyces phaeochromogenes]|uniref:DUF6907 domain-containing protein n=1 Tax=Streptomyces phaeochromogenes TaxID=1923 RepID=UPI0006E18C88|nr:hypothetical protein [Streptomyces phaeochromogenes]
MSNEDERAQKFVERHFPVTAAFLAAERGEGPAPVYGPTGLQNAHDDQPEPYVTVRVDYRVSRFELFAALAAGYATSNEMQDPDGMTVQQIRYDVEAQLSLMSWRDMEDLVESVAGQIEQGEHPEQMQALKRAMDRAYPVAPAPVRPSRTGGDTVTVDTVDHGPVTLDEPFWCLGVHPAEAYREDIVHEGEESPLLVDTACHGQVRIAVASLVQRPFSPTDASVSVAVEFDEQHEYDVAGLSDLADNLVAYAVGPLHQLIERLTLLEGDES